jgi:endonuclease III
MIHPVDIVRTDYTERELQELLIFCICVAGKTAVTIAPRVDRIFAGGRKLMPFTVARRYTEPRLIRRLHSEGIGCMKLKARAILEAAHYLGPLHETDVEELECIYGIGPKTARFFVMCHRPGVALAALDTHVLKYLKWAGVSNVPKETPAAGPTYRRLEQEFLKLVPPHLTPAEFDTIIWKSYAL